MFTFLTILMTDFSVILVLHPRHKLKYFEMAGWEEEWIQTARQIVRSEFDRTYAFMDIKVDTGADDAEDKVRVHILIYLLKFLIHILRSRHLKIYLTIFRRCRLLPPRNCTTNLTSISAWILNMLVARMCFHGGMNSAVHIPASTVWHWII